LRIKYIDNYVPKNPPPKKEGESEEKGDVKEDNDKKEGIYLNKFVI
jgi:hypothetical protein